MTSAAENSPDLDWLTTSFAERIPGVESVVVLSTDGLVLALSDGLDKDTADTLAAVSGLASLTAGRPGTWGPATSTRSSSRWTAATSSSPPSARGPLAVMCGPDCDIGLIGYEMSMLVARIGQVLTPALQAELSMRPGP